MRRAQTLTLFVIITQVTLFIGSFAAADAVRVQVTAVEAKLLAAPELNSKVLGKLNAGRNLLAEKENSNFFKLKTRSGRLVYIAAQDVEILEPVENDLIEEAEAAPRDMKRRYPFTFDLGFATGSGSGGSSSEMNLGLNYSLKKWLIWRNALFYKRFSSGSDLIGLDSSVRAFYEQSLGSSSEITLFGGPGYRLPSEGTTAPFLEGGAFFHLGGLTLGAGAKLIFNRLIDDQIDDETQFFFVLGGSGHL